MTGAVYDKRGCPESLLSPLVSEWLRTHGYTVYAEVPTMLGRTCDLVGRKGKGELIAVELKTSASRQLLKQCSCNQLVARVVYAAVAQRPRPGTLAKFSALGIGVLFVTATSIEELTTPSDKEQVIYVPCADAVNAFLDLDKPSDKAGYPDLAGQGPAQSCEQAIARYRKRHPSATWEQVYQAVPNHYANAKSMAGGMHMLRQRRRLAQRRREERGR